MNRIVKAALGLVMPATALVAGSLLSKKHKASELPDCLIDLHLHLDGSLSVETVKKLAAMQGIDIPQSDDEIKKLISLSENCRDLNEYLEKFRFALSLMQTKEAISLAVRELKKELKAQGLIYAEIRFAPQRHCDKGLTQEEAVLAAIEGMSRCDLKTNLILCCMREKGNDEANLETIRLADKYRDKGVCAVDLAGDEAAYTMDSFKYVADKAKYLGLFFTLHAGEAAGHENVRRAIELDACRIGHGIRSYENLYTLKIVADRRVPLEFCPTSNLNTSIFERIEDYPLRRYLDVGAVVTINTDNMSVSDTNLRKEFKKLIDAFELTKDEVKTLLLNSANAAFVSEKEKAELREKIETAFEQ